MDPPNADDKQAETANTEANESYIEVTFLSGLTQNKYGQLINYIHNDFRMGWDEYPNDLTRAYNLDINWKVEAGYVAIPPYYGLDLLTENIVQDSDMHATYGSVILTRDRYQVECHICGINQSFNKFPDKD